MKVVIIGGAGGVGASAAFSLLNSPHGHEIVLVDTRPEMITSHVMDLENVAALGAAQTTVRGGTSRDALDADVVVLCAAAPLRLNVSRSVYLADNLRIVAQALTPLRGGEFGGVVLMLTNPVDVLLTWVHREGWLPRGRLLGYTLNDSLRLRTGVALALGVHPRDVGGFVLGEHGDGQVPIFSRITLHGEPVTLSREQRAAARHYIDTWYPRHVALDSGRTSTWASGRGIALMIDTMAGSQGTVLPAAAALVGEFGLHDVCLGVPVSLGRHGVAGIVEWKLEAEELRGLRQAADSIETAVAGLSSTW
jgi:malate dehydrogenase